MRCVIYAPKHQVTKIVLLKSAAYIHVLCLLLLPLKSILHCALNLIKELDSSGVYVYFSDPKTQEVTKPIVTIYRACVIARVQTHAIRLHVKLLMLKLPLNLPFKHGVRRYVTH